MMPFSVFRTWFVGVASWALLGTAIYCFWEWADAEDSPAATYQSYSAEVPTTPLETKLASAANVNSDEKVVVGRPRDSDRQAWPYLAAAIALAALSSGGALPFILLGKVSGSRRPAREAAAKVQTVERKDGSRLHVEVLGRESGPTLVFTHGWSLDSSSWSYITQKLGSRFRIVTWDLPGLGKSRGPSAGDYRLEKMASDLEAVLKQTASDPAILVGHSIGAMVAQTFCRLYPQQLGKRIIGIALVHTTYTNPLRTALFAPFWRLIERPLLVPLNYLTIWLAPLAWLSNWQSYWNGSLHVITRLASFSGRQTWGELDHGAWLCAKAWPGVLARGNLAMLNFDEQRTLPKIEIPVLVVGAVHDRMTRLEASQRIGQLAPHARESSVTAGHLGLWERADEIAELIGEFTETAAQSAAPQKPKDVAAT
jgi:pimeloyl-ACP methyl ester carboxylesterase